MDLKIIPQLMREDMACGLPHRNFFNMGVVYRFEDRYVTHSVMDELGLDEQDLWNNAVNNIGKAFICPIEGMLGLLAGMDMSNMSMESCSGTFVVTNEDMRYGASVILDEDVRDKISRVMGGDYFLLPSSVHEMLAVPDNGTMTSDEMLEMVRTINSDPDIMPDQTEVLSDNIYRYSGGQLAMIM